MNAPLAPLPVFLTAYDPSELPGGTVDPLGFTSGYLALADQLFPEMTAAANQATYLPMMCAGLWIADSEGKVASGGAAGRKQRVDVALRFERLWALACGLANRRAANGHAAGNEVEEGEAEAGPWLTRGLRGVRYIERELARLEQTGARETGTEFPLLAQQYRYGAFGIYGTVAQSLQLLDKTTLAPTPGLGEVLGRSFLETTAEPAMQRELKRAACESTARVRLSMLANWGEQAHAGAPLSGETQARLREAILGHLRRREMLELVEAVRADRSGEWSDRALLDACVARREASGDDGSPLLAAMRAALAYDAFLRDVLLVFERVLWLCAKGNEAECRLVFADGVITRGAGAVGESARELLHSVDALLRVGNTELSTRGRGVVELAAYFVSGPPVADAVRRVLRRHAEIQGSKFERGRPKQAWLEERDAVFALTSARFGLRTTEPLNPDQVHAPDWRFGAALSFLDVLGSFDDRGQS